MTSWEHVLVDDGSVDSSAEIIESAAQRDPRVRLIRQENAGPAVARNRGFTCARGTDYVLFLDHDDVLEPDMLETLVGYLDHHPEAGIVYSDFSIIDEEGGVQGYAWRTRFRGGFFWASDVKPDDPEMPFEGLLMWGGILPSNALIRRSLYEEAGGFDPGFFTDDTDLFMRLGLRSSIHYVNRRLVRYRRHANQMSVDAEATSTALDKLLAEKWAVAELTPGDRRRFQRGINLRRYGADALLGFSHAASFARERKYLSAARFLAGAVRRNTLYVAANLGIIRPRP
jgi:glycosyltransferase involved in cell wall biosynthesis